MSKSSNQNKIVLLGNSGVGKTALVVRLIDDLFGDTESTIGASFFQKTIPTKGGDICLELWDTAGQEKYDSLSKFYCRGAIGGIIVYDITMKDSHKGVRKWVKKLKETVSQDHKEFHEHCFIFLIGNKLDLLENSEDPSAREDRYVSRHEGEGLLREVGGDEFVEISCKDGTNIEKVVEIVTGLVVKIAKKNKRSPYWEASKNPERLDRVLNDDGSVARKKKDGKKSDCPCGL